MGQMPLNESFNACYLNNILNTFIQKNKEKNKFFKPCYFINILDPLLKKFKEK